MYSALVLSALSFSAPMARPMRSGVTMMAGEKSASIPFLPKPEALDGTLPGDVGFDPLGLSSTFDLKWMQEAELKHGRLCMLATLGFVVTDLGITAPGAPTGFSSVAAHDMAVEKGAMYVLLFAASVIEVCAGVPAVEQMMKGSGRAPGDFAFDPLGFSKKDAAAAKRLAVNEVKNGRLAMLAFSGMVTQAVLTGHGFPYLY
eukprot:CAMPEP_0206036242 /NCGR_PEP_ID=MMETSP1466-20131121/2627_1 /ASSEMBLY_ACC=CAM_ASM_001126 /TAXON_ID=44452 /ORGANISM="Pavlova gyrans, Strain CCMP608" /LENGTH=201 /DNA_ID=CAMNT_0053410689 /DNA_START=11 /DNA_END=616 /DNA_ORIENTATION=-